MGESSIEAFGVECDVRKNEDCIRTVEAVVAKFGQLDILVNCAAGNFLAATEDLSANAFKTVLDIDTVGTFQMCRAAFPYLKKSGVEAASKSSIDQRGNGASIINISATLHRYATWWQTHASAAKAAVDSLTRSMALEWGEYNIRVNGVAPGPIAETAGLTKLMGNMDEKTMSSTVPVGRLGRKQDIAWCCVYLSSPAGAYVSGQTLVVDGAALVWRPSVASRSQVQSLSRAIEKKSRAVGVAQSSTDGNAQLPSKL